VADFDIVKAPGNSRAVVIPTNEPRRLSACKYREGVNAKLRPSGPRHMKQVGHEQVEHDLHSRNRKKDHAYEWGIHISFPALEALAKAPFEFRLVLTDRKEFVQFFFGVAWDPRTDHLSPE
jgi:hypothetical protein